MNRAARRVRKPSVVSASFLCNSTAGTADRDRMSNIVCPSGIFIDAHDTIYVTDSQSDEKTNPGFQKGIRIGSARDGSVKSLIPSPGPVEKPTPQVLAAYGPGDPRLQVLLRGATTEGIAADELQAFLDTKATALSFSTVDHLKWDLVAIFRMAVAEGVARRNPAELLFTPRECKKSEGRVMNSKEVTELFKSLELRERLIVKFAVLGGMRPGEIFALRRGYVTTTYADVTQRVYRGDLDTPKTKKSVRLAALSGGLARDLVGGEFLSCPELRGF